jgi:hypothetical protein
MIKVNGKSYKVVESLGYNHDVGAYAKVVKDGDKERIVVGTRGCWSFYTPKVLPGSHVTGQENA